MFMSKLKTAVTVSFQLLIISFVGILFLNSGCIEQEQISTTVTSKHLPSIYLTYEEEEVLVEEPVVEEEVVEDPVTPVLPQTPKIKDLEPTPTPQVEVQEQTPDRQDSTVLETLIGKLSGYGPDCYGCTSSHTASGYYVGEGNIYYNDPTYGKVRILAGDSKYPFHTIVRFQVGSISNEPIIGIVLDRGGSIGIGERFLFDLLYTSESEAATFGVSQDVTFEILRIGKG